MYESDEPGAAAWADWADWAGGLGESAPGGAPKQRGRRGSYSSAEGRVAGRVEKFDRRPIEPFELYTSEFGQNSGQNSGKILTFLQKILK